MPTQTSSQSLRSGYTPSPGRNGIYVLASHPDCDTGYQGDHWREDVFVVGLGQEGERIFLQKESTQAVAYARETKLRLHRLNASTLCSDAMLATFGS